MTQLEEVLATLEELLAGLSADCQFVRNFSNVGERFVGVTLVSDHGGASVGLWAREHVGGLLDVEVLDADGTQRLWRHLEKPTVAQLREAWAEMLGVYGGLAAKQ